MSLKNFAYSLMIAALSAAPLLAQDGGEGAAPAQSGPFGGSFMFIMIFMILIIYFIMIRPEQRRQKERQKMLSHLKKGDKIVTIGGICGVIQSVRDMSYVIKSGEGAVLEIIKSAVQGLAADAITAKETVKESDEQVKGQA